MLTPHKAKANSETRTNENGCHQRKKIIDDEEDDGNSNFTTTTDDDVSMDEYEYMISKSPCKVSLMKQRNLKIFENDVAAINDKKSFGYKVGFSVNNIERKPTRQPNPKIRNRNALMARENRRKKKEYMEHIEKTLQEKIHQNKQYKKVLKSKEIVIKSLNSEILYLRSVLANKTGIMSLLRSLQNNNKTNLPITSSVLTMVTDTNDDRTFSNGNKSTSTNPTISPIPFLSSVPENENENDLLTDFPTQSLNDWETSLLTNNTINIDYNENGKFTETLSEINSNKINKDHNYVHSNSIDPKLKVREEEFFDIDAKTTCGVCLHIFNKRVSLEFCAFCHQHAKNAWSEEI